MTDHVLARNLILVVESLLPGDPLANIVYSDVSAPIELFEDEADVGVEVTVTQIQRVDPRLFMDVWLQGSNDLASWTTLTWLFSASSAGTLRAQHLAASTRYVRVLYHLNIEDFQLNPPQIGDYFIFDAAVNTGPGASND